MKILITGSNGLLGQKIIDAAIQNQNITLVATSAGTDRRTQNNGYEYLSLDITNAEEINKVLNATMPEVVINTAAMTNVDACEQNPEQCELLNVTAVEHLANACKKLNIKLIHLSTDFIFDGQNGPYSETDTPNPLSVYAKSKVASEEIVIENSSDNCILRTQLVYGYTPILSRSNIVLWAIDALKNNKPINVVNDQYRTPTLAEDLAQACILAAEKKAKGVYNISGADYMNMYELVCAVANALNLSHANVKSCTSAELNQPANRPPRTGFNIEKAKKDLNFLPHNFDSGVRMVIKHMAISNV